MNYMLEDGTMEWQGSLRTTYNKYLHPEVLDYTTPEMWEQASDGHISSLFQFDTLVGGQAIKKIQPRSLTQLAIANSIMRLMAEGEQPIDIYVKQKLVPDIWYDDMYNSGLTRDEIRILEKYLKEKDGVADSQEVVMQLSMDPHISNFDMKEANKLRKTIAKKKFAEIEAVKQLFYTKGAAAGTSVALLDYVWNKQFKLSFGYSFSTIHTTGYSLIALQEMNLAFHYPIIYWNCACLSVDSSAINEADFYNLVDDAIITLDDVDGKRVANKMDYAKLAAALDKFRGICEIRLPDINKSRLAFTPDAANNIILYGLKGITRITEPVIAEIMEHRPFSSLQDFVSKVTKKVVTKDKIINLIKSGAFNEIEGTNDKKEILTRYISMISEPKSRLTMQNANALIDANMMPENLQSQCEMYKLTKLLRTQRDSNKLWYFGDALEIPENKLELWRDMIIKSGIEPITVEADGQCRRALNSKSWDKMYEGVMAPMKKYITDHQNELLQKYNQYLFDTEFNKYCGGNDEQWELDSLNFYFTKDPIRHAEPQIESAMDLDISSLDDMVEGAQDGEFFIKGKVIPKYRLYTIAGTVIDRDKVKGLVTLQCPSGVIGLKLYKDLYATFVSVSEEEGQDSFFEKGVHLLVTGILRGSTFIPKVYKNTGRKAILKINLDDDDNFINTEEKLGA